MRAIRFAAALAVVLGMGCSNDEQGQLAGHYTGVATNGANSCPGDWTPGDTSSLSLRVHHTGAAVSVTVESGSFIRSELGSEARTFSGTANGLQMEAALLGTDQHSEGECHFVWRATMTANLVEDALQGTIRYVPQTDNNPDCAVQQVTNCERLQSFSVQR